MGKILNIDLTTEIVGDVRANSGIFGNGIEIAVDENGISHLGEVLSYNTTETRLTSVGNSVHLEAETITFEGNIVKRRGENTFSLLTQEDISTSVSQDDGNIITSGGVYSYVQEESTKMREFVKTYFNTDASFVVLDNSAASSWLNAQNIAKIKIGKQWLADQATSITEVRYKSRTDGKKLTQSYYLELSQDNFETAIRSINTATDGGETENVWQFMSFPLDKDKDLWMRGVNTDGNPINIAPQTKNRPSDDTDTEMYVPAGTAYQWIPKISIYTASAFVGHASDPLLHLDRQGYTIIERLKAGQLFTNQNTASLALSTADGISMQSADLFGRVEVRNAGVVITSKQNPRWMDAESPTYQQYDFITKKDLNITDTDFNALVARVAALEAKINELTGN